MHARPRAAGGTRASSSSLNDTAMHQHGRSGSLPPAIAQPLPAPQSGQMSGGTGSLVRGRERILAAHGEGARRAIIR
jgi:hypothetical protein